MDKENQLKLSIRDLYKKIAWINKKMEKSLAGYTSSEVHCIEYIERTADPNVTKLAEFFYMTRGAISKMTKKLIKKGVIESYQKLENKKEVYFRLTEKGKEVYRIHEALHQEFEERDKKVFEQMTEEQYEAISYFVEMYSSHLDEEIKKQGKSIKE
ncbi:MarR family transcriptional regulator [Enterococcus sp. CWB-B31]|uniref:MarR family transcriptional regulator n=1 Tax=Enterococcus sp. CWB-B31 TaxID=2885159 RepID=UPI001E4667A1|nr:MarR family transcriptional regulator [Enterococcus sp. CWB-B31]MCB5954935.1 MarR family transcriptional regulator [Enterococcus sp. CWB-B31]